MGKQNSMFDDLEGTPLREGKLHVDGKSIPVGEWDINSKPVKEVKHDEMNPFNNPVMIDPFNEGADINQVEKTFKKNKKVIDDIVIKSNVTSWVSKSSSLPEKQVIKGNVPSKSNCYKIIHFKSKDPLKSAHASLGKTSALIQYEKDFFIQANQYRNLGIDEYFEFEIDVYYPTQRSDLDNSLKVVLDCLQKIGAIKNDNKCTKIIAQKFLDKENPRIEFVIKKSMK